MRKISICGIDGSGKSTLVGEIERVTKEAKAPVAVLRALRYSSGNDLPVNRLSDKICDMGVLGDEAGLPALKACALFLAMTLYGTAESELCQQSGCRVLVRERDPIADSLSYAQIYLQLIKEPFPDKVVATYGDAEYDGYLRELLQRESLGFKALSFAELPMYTRAVFSTPFPDIIPVLEKIYNSSTADAVVFLRLTPEMLKKRLELKVAENRGRAMEFHETHERLARLQSGLEKAILALRERRQFELVTVDVVDRPARDLAQELVQRLVS